MNSAIWQAVSGDRDQIYPHYRIVAECVKRNFSHILKVELYTREHNGKKVEFYKRLGFVDEGRQERKIYVESGKFRPPLHMAWFNPNFVSW